MVDDIKLNRISPLLSSAERVKRVERRQHDHKQPPFKDALKDEDKKKKKKKKVEEETLSESISARNGRELPAHAVKGSQKLEKELKREKTKKIIDIRV